ncbi:MAG: hypothetical protein HC778_07500, partial [Chamaesiphon sp. CSU_1_12]|nr:hypothetical protein [Chamaesiphon sp. CSU_1_12]
MAPITPFVMGGEFAAKNVNAVEAVESMKARASVAVQIRDVFGGSGPREGLRQGAGSHDGRRGQDA